MKRRRRSVPIDNDLSRYADGRAWRLKRGRDFQGSVGAFRKSLRGVAHQLGKVAQAVPDKLQPDKYVWIQFGDARIVKGDPCPLCGSRLLERTARHWVRCTDCRAQLILVEPPPTATPAAVDVQTPLDTFANVVLYEQRVENGVEHCFGTATAPTGERLALAVDFPLEEGSRIPHAVASGQWQYALHFIPYSQFEPLLDLTEIEDAPRVDWRIAEDAGPLPVVTPDPAPG